MNRAIFYELRFKLLEYIKQYGKYYTSSQVLYIMNNFFPSLESKEVNTLLLQVYEEMGVSNLLSNNIYENFIRHIKNDCDIDNNLLEVGAGVIPSLAKSLKKQQTKGSITVIDPKVKIENYGDLKIIKDKFDEHTDTSKYKLIYGNFPCKATRKIIESSFINDIDIYISLCGCTEGKPYFFYSDYLDELEYLLFELSSGTTRKYDVLEYDDLAYPIIKTYK